MDLVGIHEIVLNALKVFLVARVLFALNSVDCHLSATRHFFMATPDKQGTLGNTLRPDFEEPLCTVPILSQIIAILITTNYNNRLSEV